jgi:hypothetical protein
MKRIGTVPSLNNSRYVIYRNCAADAKHKFAGWKNVNGALIYDSPLFLVGVSAEISFNLRKEPLEDATLALKVTSKSYKPSRTQVFLDDRLIAEYEFANYGEMLNKQIPLGKLNGGEVLRFVSANGTFDISSENKVFSLVFEEVRVFPTPAPAATGTGTGTGAVPSTSPAPASPSAPSAPANPSTPAGATASP